MRTPIDLIEDNRTTNRQRFVCSVDLLAHQPEALPSDVCSNPTGWLSPWDWCEFEYQPPCEFCSNMPLSLTLTRVAGWAFPFSVGRWRGSLQRKARFFRRIVKTAPATAIAITKAVAPKKTGGSSPKIVVADVRVGFTVSSTVAVAL